MISEMQLVIPLYLVLFLIWYRFRHVIKAMTVKHILMNDEFFGDTMDTPREGTEQHQKQEYLKGKSASIREKMDARKSIQGKLLIISKPFAEYKQREITEIGNKN